MLARLFVVLLLAPLVLPLAAAAPDPTAPGVDRWVEATFDLEQPTLTRIDLSGDLLIRKHPIGSRVHSATDMSRQYQGTVDFGEGAGATFVASMEDAVRTAFGQTLAASFPDAARTITLVDVDEASLLADRQDAFDPPVRVRVAATLERTREAVGLAGVDDAGVAAVLAAGGRIRSDLALSAQPGHDLTYVVHAPQVPEGAAFSQVSTGVVAADGASVKVEVDNARGASTLTRTATLHLLDPAAEAPPAETVETVVEVRMGALARGADRVPLEATVRSALGAIATSRFPGALPPNVDLEVLSADGLRALRQSGVVTDEDLAAADAAFLDALVADLAATLGAADVTGGIDRADLERVAARPYRLDPPVQFLAEATGAYALPGDGADADLALALGASVRLDLTLASRSGETTYLLHPPPGAQFFEPVGGTVSADGLTARFAVPPGEAAQASVVVRRGDAPAYDAEDAALGILVDLRDIDVTVGQAMGGDFGTLLADVTVRGELGVIAVPDGVTDTLGASLDLDFVSSDGVRLLLDRGLLTRERLDELEATLLAEVRGNLARALGADVTVDGGFLDASLDVGLVSDPPTGDTPVVFEAKATFSRPLSSPTQAAIALYSVPQSFTFPRVRDLDTTYTVVLPRGLAVTSLDASGARSETREWSDGREAFVVTPTGDSAQATVTMAVTPGFVLLKFWPLVLGAIVVLVLLVGTPIALVVLRRRKA